MMITTTFLKIGLGLIVLILVVILAIFLVTRMFRNKR